MKHAGKKCANATAGECAAGSGGSFQMCADCVQGENGCNGHIVAWQPNTQAHMCQCVAATDTCEATVHDASYNVYTYAPKRGHELDGAIFSCLVFYLRSVYVV